MRLTGPTLLPTTLLADLRRLDADPSSGDVLEVMAACMRHREAALLCLIHEDLVWPVTLFPNEGVYHSPRDIREASVSGMAGLKLASAEPPGVKAPGHSMHERIGQAEHYQPLVSLLWFMALNGPRRTLLAEIGGPAAYRMVGASRGDRLSAPGAVGSAIERLQRNTATLREVAHWPGMSTERANRLINGLYLANKLLITRMHVIARDEHQSTGRSWFGRRGA
jgi:hypothetical protein